MPGWSTVAERRWPLTQRHRSAPQLLFTVFSAHIKTHFDMGLKTGDETVRHGRVNFGINNMFPYKKSFTAYPLYAPN